MRKCSVATCSSKFYCKGYCIMHYRRWRRWGNPETTINHEPMAERLARYSERSGGCLLWAGGKARNGYGSVGINGGSQLAHRAAWEVANEPVPEGMELDHICHNRACIEVSHLRVTTKSQNQQNRGGPASHGTSGYRGVRRKGKRWQGQAKLHGVNHYTEIFDTPEEADVAVADLRRRIFTHSEMDKQAAA